MNLTATETAIKKAATCKQEVCKLLNWTEMDYASYQYEQGLAYLQAYIPTDPQGIKELEESRVFWNWWKNHWTIRDESFLIMQPCKINTPAQWYELFHNAKDLSRELHPRAIVLGKSYSKMIGKFIKSIL